LPDINSGQADEGDFYFANDSGGPATVNVEMNNFYDVGNTLSPHAVVSTLNGDVAVKVDGPTGATNFAALYKNRTTQSLYGSAYEANAAFWSFGRNVWQVQGFGLEGQIFDTNSGVLSSNGAPRHFGDWFWRNADFVPGSNGPFRVVTSPTSGRAMPQSGIVVTSTGTIATNTSAGANVTGFIPATLHTGDNLILVGADGSGGNVNASVSCIDTAGTGTACAGLGAQGIVVTPVPGCIASSNCPGPATVQWQTITVTDFGLDATRMSAAPTTGTWNKGQIVWNSSPSASALGWVATASGTPGTWVAFPSVPLPTGSTIGGVFTKSCAAGQHIYSINSDGTATCTTDAGSSPQSIHLGCAGPATPSATVYMSDALGPCSGTPSNGYGQLMTGSGFLSNLTVRCNATGVNASSGVFTVKDQPSGGSAAATTLTVTYGTTAAGTFIQDTTHTPAYAAGDLISVVFTTQASETLGTCAVAFNY
jgi:hypothetical protein